NTAFTSEDGQLVRLGDYRGKVVLVDFWGVWCRPCLAEMPSLQQLQENLRGENERLAFVFVSIRTESFERDDAWLRHGGLVGKAVRWDSRTAEQYHAFFYRTDSKWWVPNSVILDASGNVAKWVRGSGTDWSVSTDLVRSLISDQSKQR